MSNTEWKNEANKQYDSLKNIIIYQNSVKKNENWRNLEQNWIDINVVPLMEFMGSKDLWKSVLKTNNLDISGIEKRGSTRIAKKKGVATHNAEAVFEGNDNGGHWYSRKKGELEFFNSYNEYQILGTNLWCQTFALLNVTNRLPKKFHEKSICKYYYYNYYTLLFIQECVTKYSKKNQSHLVEAIQECIKFPNICINAVEIDRKTVSIPNDKNCHLPQKQEIKNEFQKIKDEKDKLKIVEEQDSDLWTIKELKHLYTIKNLKFKSSWKKKDYIQNLTL